MNTIKNNLAKKLLKTTTSIAASSTAMSPLWYWSEPKLPTSLLKK